jgi:hypothetical protein
LRNGNLKWSIKQISDIAATSLDGPTLPAWALQQVGSYLIHTGRCANRAARQARDRQESIGLGEGL